ncbi:MAG: calcium/sodium antiporter [Lachnospiraceae bacterium]|nr:calcium/sodium antiporter [Lachnospiraceae bacterium]
MLVPILLFLLGFALLIKGGDWFVDGATGLAHRFRLPEFLIGATVVSIGTTLPEVMVSAQAAFGGVSGISYGNAVGSIICNTSLIAALTVAIAPSVVKPRTLRIPVITFFGAAALYAVFAYTAGRFERWMGILLLAVFLVYMVYTVLSMKKEPEAAETSEASGTGAPSEEAPLWKDLLLLVAGAAAIAIGARLLVDNGTLIAQALGVPDSVIGLTMVALGTSLPELITAITSLIKGHGSLSLGNIIGANLFNIVLVSGLAITISPFDLPAEKMLAGMNASLVVDLPVMFLVMGLLCLPPLVSGKLKRWQGITLLAVYAAFTAFQFLF